MIFPIGDTPNPQRFTAWVNLGLIALNVLIYLVLTLPLSLQGADPADPVTQQLLQLLAARYPELSPAVLLQNIDRWDVFVQSHGFIAARPSWSALFGSMFLHSGFAHLAGNMLFLWIYGDNIEHRLGRLGYLAFWLGCGVAATAGQVVLNGFGTVPMIGASGAISGVLGAYFLLFPRNRVRLLVALFPIYVNVLLVPARLVLGAYLVLDNLLPVLFGSQTGVAYGAHIGGFLAGLAGAAIVRRRELPAPVPVETVSRARAHLNAATALLERGQVASAYHHLHMALGSEPDPETERRVRELLARIVLRRR
jgi:membrane associated rhomboid family serine protease